MWARTLSRTVDTMTMHAPTRTKHKTLLRRNGNLLAGSLLTGALLVVTTPSSAGAQPGKSAEPRKAPIEDQRITPARTPGGTRPAFRGLLEAPAGEAFFNPPTPLPGVPGDIVWAMRSPTPCEDLWGAPSGTCTARIPPVRGTTRTAEIWRIVYHTLDRAGRPRAASAIVVADPPTASTSRIMVTQHGSYGLGDQCGVIDSRMGGGFAGVGYAAEHYLSKGWVIVAPSAPGARAPGVQTSLISGDATRSVIDAAWAAHIFTGALPETIVHGHSVGGMMVTGVGGEATSYAPQLHVRGIIANAPAGVSGPHSPVFDVTRGPVLGKPFDYQAARTKTFALALIAAYAQAYAPGFKPEQYLTKVGKRTWKRVQGMCVDEAAQHVVGLSWDELFTQTPDLMDTGTMQRLSNVPTWFIISRNDSYADPLNVYHAYQTLCAAGQPSYLSVLDLSHEQTLRALGENDQSGLKDWIDQVVAGNVPAGACLGMQPTLAAWQKYTYNQIALALGMRIPSKAVVSVKAAGHCRTKAERGFVTVTPGGTCTLTVTITRDKRSIQNHTQAFATVDGYSPRLPYSR